MSRTSERQYELLSLSGGGYRAALYNAGVLRAFHAAGNLDTSDSFLVNSVSGGSIPAMIWREYMGASNDSHDDQWPERALFDLILSSPSRGGGFNWHLPWLTISLLAGLFLTLSGKYYFAVNLSLAIVAGLCVFIVLALRSGLDARWRWLRHLSVWWDRHRLKPSPLGLNPFYLVETLDYLSGESWIYDNGCLVPATRDNLKTRTPFPSARIPMSIPSAIVTATAFPPIFAGTKIPDARGGGARHLFKDAGVIDNLAMLPLLRIIERIPPNGERLGNIKRWFISDAGAPMAVPSGATLATVGNTRTVKSVGLISHMFRLAGDLSQPRFVKAITDVLQDYAEIPTTIIGIGLSLPEGELPWVEPLKGEPNPAEVGTHLASMPRHLALRIFAEGAQAASAVLVRDGLMQRDQRQTLKRLVDNLAS
jgi:hypothetical protein